MEDLFGVKVESVNTQNVRESLKESDSQGIQTGSEKAIVTLKEGSKPIELLNNTPAKKSFTCDVL